MVDNPLILNPLDKTVYVILSQSFTGTDTGAALPDHWRTSKRFLRTPHATRPSKSCKYPRAPSTGNGIASHRNSPK